MAFFEQQFDPRLSFGARGGPVFNTLKAYNTGGKRQANKVWSAPVHRYDVSHCIKTGTDFNTIRAFFYNVSGAFDGFRFKDWQDYVVSSAQGVLTLAVGATQQLGKAYSIGSRTYTRSIVKPVSGTVVVYNNGTPLVLTTNYTIDYTTGIVTLIARAVRNVTAVTVGATTQVTLSSANGSAIGNYLYLVGLTGADAALLNGGTFAITNIAGAVYTLSVNTTGKTITPGAGTATWYYGGTGDVLSWSGQFDVPVAFVKDEFDPAVVDNGSGELLIQWGGIQLEEVR